METLIALELVALLLIFYFQINEKNYFFNIILTFDTNAEIVTAIGKHKHLGDKTKIQSCKIAEEKAKKCNH